MKKRNICILAFAVVLGLPFLIPDPAQIPVIGATSANWNKDTFWYEPWGSSGVHKGIDIFADKGTAIIAPTPLLILYRGEIPKGGKIVVAIGSKWRIHYFAHLEDIDRRSGRFVTANTRLGSVGDTGNAQGKPPHLHYSIVSLLPRPWAIDASTQGYKKAFYLNPIAYFGDT